MFAVVETGGKQYKVSPGQTVEVEKLPAEPGDTVELGRVLLISTDDTTLVGAPLVDDAKVVARVSPVRRGPKIIVFRYKSKARYRRKTGHRQDYSVLTIEDIWANGSSLLPAKEEAEEVETAAVVEEEVKAPKKTSRRKAAAKEEAEASETEEVVEVKEVVEEVEAEPASEPEPKRGRRRASKADKEE
ncbi:MAG TPA: 50S ribosomal protein L21 [Ktedonobacterales bacterium]|nr:50S ribosomal protein L21 [Ktedonobacterales bacterium]